MCICSTGNNTDELPVHMTKFMSLGKGRLKGTGAIDSECLVCLFVCLL